MFVNTFKYTPTCKVCYVTHSNINNNNSYYYNKNKINTNQVYKEI